ncbi:hypothetical protein GDO81_026197 [Engystomops pustulosus]|uniref:Uncharacterized protein n=1 Tax=Engystomops pustulosus TaxID=76066 RepID=A0AAV6YLI6_ENGPU|nr:hypothetical protein GDO81_026197 [Engystomops pustulosus]
MFSLYFNVRFLCKKMGQMVQNWGFTKENTIGEMHQTTRAEKLHIVTSWAIYNAKKQLEILILMNYYKDSQQGQVIWERETP